MVWNPLREATVQNASTFLRLHVGYGLHNIGSQAKTSMHGDKKARRKYSPGVLFVIRHVPLLYLLWNTRDFGCTCIVIQIYIRLTDDSNIGRTHITCSSFPFDRNLAG